MAFEDLAFELSGIVPGYSIFLAEKAIARAWQAIIRRRTWSFLVAEGAFNAPPLINTGSVTTQTNSVSVVANTAAAAALNAVVAATPVLTARQFRVGFGGSIYNISAWNNGTKTLTLDRPFLEAGASGQQYQVYQCYFPPPPQALLAGTPAIYDFNRWLSVLDVTNGYPLSLMYSKAWLDRKDPQRTSANLSYIIVDYKADVNGNPLYEFWPHPINGQTFTCVYKRKGQAVITGLEPIPDIISESLIIDRALYKSVYPWAAVQAGRDPKLGRVNWVVQQEEASKQWESELQTAKLEDDNVFLQSIVGPMRQRGYMGPVDSTWLSSHDASFFIR